MPERFSFFRPKRPRKFRKGPGFSEKYGGRPYWNAIRKRILIRDNWQCRHCGRVCDKGEAQVDHILRKGLGGGDEESNLQVLCITCHGKKSRAEQLSG